MRIFLILLLLLPGAVSAGGVEALKAFLSQTQTVKARFAQMVLDKNMKTIQFQVHSSSLHILVKKKVKLIC